MVCFLFRGVRDEDGVNGMIRLAENMYIFYLRLCTKESGILW